MTSTSLLARGAAWRSLAVAALVAAAAVTHAVAHKPCGDWTLYKQCGMHWSNDRLGTSSQTICDAGCAMSSVAMALATEHERVNGDHIDPGRLNSWLRDHGGYEGGDELVWNAVAKLGRLHVKSAGPLSAAKIREEVSHCHPVIANVRGGSHWVLIVGWDDKDEDNFLVNDPGFPDVAYEYSGMSHWIAYTNSSKADVGFLQTAELDTATAPRTSLADAMRWSSEAEAEAEAAEETAVAMGGGGVYGVDVSSGVDKSALHCMRAEHDVSFVVARAYEEDCVVDAAAVGTLKAAHAAGMHVDAYHFPCQSKDAKSQVDESIHHLHSNGVNFTTYWIDIENSNWGGDHARNVKFISDLAAAAKGHGVDVGIYTSSNSWAPITGDSHELSKKYRLWWPNYGSPPQKDFHDFSAFGGWTRPYLKQYKGNVGLCGASVDVSWRPGGKAEEDVAVAAPDAQVESCGYMKKLVEATFSHDHNVWLCIAHAESSYEPHARNPSGATGLFQIMPSHCGEPGCPGHGNCVHDLEDPQVNARCAKHVYESQGFGAWTTYGGCVHGGGPCQE
mmetsp:Transcript_11328/g.39468  ORF Transcript_11328/g.39468 Transcript_11328/m.39468 type:complete len:560 (-) Transcript_11328:178-1857(-)